MAEAGQKKTTGNKDKREEDDAKPPQKSNAESQTAEKGKKLKEDLDKIIDEIDDILEENAEEFVKSYVQRGGE